MVAIKLHRSCQASSAPWVEYAEWLNKTIRESPTYRNAAGSRQTPLMLDFAGRQALEAKCFPRLNKRAIQYLALHQLAGILVHCNS